MIDTAAVNAQLDIRAIAESAGARFHRNSSACPVHGGDNPTAFSIFDNGRAWKCFTHESECNRFGHDAIALVCALNDWTFKQFADEWERTHGQTPAPDPLQAAKRAAENAERIARELEEQIKRAEKAVKELREAKRWIDYHLNMGEIGRQEWRKRGIADSLQNEWGFGYAPDFGYSFAKSHYTSPTLTIPLFEINADEPENVKHRLLSPIEPKSKYRYEQANIPAIPFYADRTLPLNAALRIIFVEGEICGAKTFQLIDGISAWQVVGMPSKNQRHRIWPMMAEATRGQECWVVPDPDAVKDGLEFAQILDHARIIHLPGKVDDMVNAGAMDRAKFCRLMDTAVVVK